MKFGAIDSSKCIGDALCVAVCPARLFKMESGQSVPQIKAEASERCINCGHCVAICPSGAISLERMPVSQCIEIDQTLHVNYEQLGQLMRSRRSIRLYQHKDVEQEKLQALIALASHAPTARNTQQIGWSVIDSAEKVRQAAQLVIDFFQKLVDEKNPLSEKYNMAGMINAWQKGYDGIARGANALVITHAPKSYEIGIVDSSITLTYFELAASTMELGCCWGGIFMMAVSQSAPLQQFFQIPQEHKCLGVMMVGYPQYKYQRIPQRNTPNVNWL